MKKLLALAFALLLSPAFAATTPNSFVTPQTPNRGIVRFLQGTDAPLAWKTIYTAGANGSRCYAAWSANSDTTSVHALVMAIWNGGIPYSSRTDKYDTGRRSERRGPPQQPHVGFRGRVAG